MLAGVVFLLALALREQFYFLTEVVGPFRGDSRQYVAYAYNIVHSGVFSSVWPGTGLPSPDAFRGPGYSLYLATAMVLRPSGDAWYPVAIHGQAILGASTALITMALGRLFLARGPVIFAGLVVAVWPHLIAATTALLSEVVLGFLLALGLWATARSQAGSGRGSAISAGGAFAAAVLVNPLILLFPPLAAVFFWKSKRFLACCLLLIPVLANAGWSIRSNSLAASPEPGRAAMNLVQGSWPDMQQAWRYRLDDPTAAEFVKQVDDQVALAGRDPKTAVHQILDRLGMNPGYYLQWYLLEKPYLLWDWDVRIGTGDVYVQEVRNSPLETNPVLVAVKSMLKLLNPLVFLASAGMALVTLFRARRGDAEVPQLLLAAFCVYVTVMHAVFQAEPRYAIPYRPFEILLAVAACSLLAARFAQVRSRWSER